MDARSQARDEIMIIHPADRFVVKWAVDHGFSYEYLREYGLPEPCLRVQLGVSSAFFKAGELVHWRADVQGCYLDQLMFELTSLFGLCGQFHTYSFQEVFLSSAEPAQLPPS
jgi:hypothetical protein